MGGSGCGKSTLLHVLMGLKSPQAGEVFFGDVNFGQFSRCAAAMYAQCGCAFPKRRPLEFDDALPKYIALPLQQYTDLGGMTRYGNWPRSLALVGLSGFEDYYPSEISGGMSKRAGSLPELLALDPHILFSG